MIFYLFPLNKTFVTKISWCFTQGTCLYVAK